MEKKDKREFTDEEVLAIVKCCSDTSTGCGVCPANVPNEACHDAYTQCIGRLLEMYEAKCKELKEWQESHAVCIKDIRERGDREAELEGLVRSYQDQYIKSREECDKLHAYNTELHEHLDKTLEIADELEKENKKLKEENEELTAASKHLIQLRDDYRDYIPKLTEANNNLKAENEDLNAQVKSLSDKLAELEHKEPKDISELMKMADFWKSQYEATRKLLDETKVECGKVREEFGHLNFLKEHAREYYEGRLKKQPKETADKIIAIINEPFMYRFIGNLKRYTEKDVVNIVDKVLAEFRTGLVNSIKMEEFYEK